MSGQAPYDIHIFHPKSTSEGIWTPKTYPKHSGGVWMSRDGTSKLTILTQVQPLKVHSNLSKRESGSWILQIDVSFQTDDTRICEKVLHLQSIPRYSMALVYLPRFGQFLW